MKKFLKVVLLTICFVMVSAMVYATDVGYKDVDLINLIAPNPYSSNEIRVQLNGEFVDFTDENGNKVEPQIINNRTMVPMRKIFEVFGGKVEWYQEEKRIKANVEGSEITLQINNPIATVKNSSGEVKEIKLDSAPVVRDSRTLVPVRFIAESIDKKVGWDSSNRAVIIIDTSFIEKTLKEKTPTFYAYLTDDYQDFSSYDMSVDLDGKVLLKDKENSKNDETLNIDGTMDLKISEDAILVGIDFDFNGKGSTIEEMKAEGTTDLEAKIIIDLKNGAVYLSSNSIEGYENKWIKKALSEEDKAELKATIQEAYNNKTQNTIEALENALVLEDNMTVVTYRNLESVLEGLTYAMNDNNFKVSGTDDKTYTFKLDLSNLVSELIKGLSSTNTDIDSKIVIEAEIKVEDKLVKNSNVEFVVEFKDDTHLMSIEIEANGKVKDYNNVVITIPEGKNVIDYEDTLDYNYPQNFDLY